MNEAACKRLTILTHRAYSWRDPAIQVGVALLTVFFIGLTGGFFWATDRTRTTELQLKLAVGRACIDYVQRINILPPLMAIFEAVQIMASGA